MEREIEVVATDSIDGPEDSLGRGAHLERSTAAAQVPQHERQAEPGRKSHGCIIPRSRVEARPHLLGAEHEAGNGIERHNALRSPGGVFYEIGREPVSTERGRSNDYAFTVAEGHAQRRLGSGLVGIVDRHDAVAKRQSAEPEPFFLCLEVDLLGRQFLLELALEVVEQVVPAHAATLVSGANSSVGLSTATIWGMDRSVYNWFSVLHPQTGVYTLVAKSQSSEPVVTVALTQQAEEPAEAATEAHEPLPSKVIRARFVEDEFFGQQPTPSSALPNPEPLLENLTRCVIEILAGARELEQIARWVTDDVYRHLLKRVVLSSRARQAKGQNGVRPTFSIGSTSVCEPRDGVVEAVVIVRGRARTRAVALRLEGLDNRWRATAINVL